MTKIGPPKGEANAKGDFEVEFKLYGNPQYVEAPGTINLSIIDFTDTTVSLSWIVLGNTDTTGFIYQVVS